MADIALNENKKQISSMGRLRQSLSRNFVFLLFCLAAVIILATPLQHHFSLGRFQHWGIAIVIFGLGYIAQALALWKNFGYWARRTYLATGFFIASIGLTYYCNPWLDSRMNLQGSDKAFTRIVLIAFNLFLGVAIIPIWRQWIKEETLRTAQTKEHSNRSEGKKD
jgi:uncharacterized membrane protein YcjF (UPF0283 family)